MLPFLCSAFSVYIAYVLFKIPDSHLKEVWDILHKMYNDVQEENIPEKIQKSYSAHGSYKGRCRENYDLSARHVVCMNLCVCRCVFIGSNMLAEPMWGHEGLQQKPKTNLRCR